MRYINSLSRYASLTYLISSNVATGTVSSFNNSLIDLGETSNGSFKDSPLLVSISYKLYII